MESYSDFEQEFVVILENSEQQSLVGFVFPKVQAEKRLGLAAEELEVVEFALKRDIHDGKGQIVGLS